MSNEASIEKKAELVAKEVIDSNPKFKDVQGTELLKAELAKGLVMSHEKGNIDIDRMMENSRGKENREEGRSR
jgi:hypothetical protein